MTSEAQRRASAEFAAKRKAAGWRKVTFWIAPEVLAELEHLKAIHGTKDAALAFAVLGATSDRKPDEKPPVARKTAPAKAVEVDAPLRMPRADPGARLKKTKGKG